ncbi:MAG TPA: leucine-rich repeat domain-containing protein [Verrucomicrobiae bacterium]|nr:leucine-rich repeat domain-containing protein [Verrucomicrobiae bacterium]
MNHVHPRWFGTHGGLIICLLFFLLIPVLAQAQLTFTTNSGAITITGYNGNPTVVTIPNTTNGYKVTSIATDAFIDKASITNIMIGTNVSTIGYAAFSGCSFLTSVALPNSVTNIGEYAFANCLSLISATLPNQIGILSSEIFGGSSSLTSITIPASVTNIQSEAFDNCSGVAAIYCQGNEPTPGVKIFVGVPTTTKVYYLAGTMGWGATYGGLTTVELNSGLQISNIAVQNNEFGFTFTGTNNQVIVVEACTNLANANWQLLQTNTLTGTSFNFTDSQWQNFPRRFYRVLSP